MVILPNTLEDKATILAQKIVDDMANTNLILTKKTKVYISCSVGVSTSFPKDINDGKILITNADEALYKAKEEGRNRHCVFSKLIKYKSN